jgi:hypothetical protein
MMGLTDNGLQHISKEGLVTYSRYYPGICLERLMKTSIVIAGIQVKIQSQNLLNTKQ